MPLYIIEETLQVYLLLRLKDGVENHDQFVRDISSLHISIYIMYYRNDDSSIFS